MKKSHLALLLPSIVVCVFIVTSLELAFATTKAQWEQLSNKWALLNADKNFDELFKAYDEQLLKAEKEGNLIRQATFSLWITLAYLRDADDYTKAVEYGKKTLELIDQGEKVDISEEPEESFYPWALTPPKEWSKATWYKDRRYELITELYGLGLNYKHKFNEVVELAEWELKKAQTKGDRKQSIECALKLNGIYLDNLKNYSRAIEYGELALKLLNEGLKAAAENDPDDWFYIELKEKIYIYDNVPKDELAKKAKRDWYMDKKRRVLYPLSQAYKFVGDNKKAEFYLNENNKIQLSEEELWEGVKEGYKKSIKDCQKQIDDFEKDKTRYIKDYVDGEKFVKDQQANLAGRIKELEEGIVGIDKKIAEKKVGVKDIYQQVQDLAMKGDLRALAIALKDLEVESRSFYVEGAQASRGQAAQEYINIRVYPQIAAEAFSYGLYQEAYDYAIKALASQEKYLLQYKEYLDKEALKMAEQWREGYQKGFLEEAEFGFGYEQVWLIASRSLRQLGRNNEAITFLEKAYNYHGDEDHLWHAESMNAMEGLPIRTEILQELAFVYRQAGMNQKSIDVLKELIDYFEGIRAKLTQSTQKIGYLSRYTQAYEQIITLLVSEKSFSQALSYLERARSRAFVDLLGEKPLKPKNKEAEVLVEKKETLKRQYAQLLKEKPTPQDTSSHQRSIKVVQKQIDNLMAELLNKDREFSSLTVVKTLSAEEIQALLGSDTALLEYYLTPDALFIWVVTKEDLVVKKLDIPRWILSRKIMEFRQSFLSPTGQGILKAAYDLSQVRYEITPKKFKNGDEYTYRVYVKNNSSLFLSLDELEFKAGERSYKQNIFEKEISPQAEKIILEQAIKWKVVPSKEQVILKTDQGLLKSNILEVKVDLLGMVTVEDRGSDKETGLILNEAKKYAEISLYDILIKPVQPYLVKKRLFIVPHGMLHYIPFSALSNNNRYLIEDYALSYLPSATVYKFCKEKEKKLGDKILALGNPDLNDPSLDIPFALVEVKSIASLYPASKVLVRAQATKAAFESQSYDYDVLHLACHGIFDADNPSNSSLLLSPAGLDDGRLTMNEIFDLELNAGLVTLSACQSGLSRIKAGDETMGLPRAFIYAGTPSVVASLWNVNDESTAILMEKFYHNLKVTNKTESLRLAQLELLKNPKYKNPYYWAAFFLTGE